MDWKTSLDHYLTTPPEDSYYANWVEAVESEMSDEFFEKYEDELLDDKHKLYERLWNHLIFPKPMQAAQIIERFYSIYKL